MSPITQTVRNEPTDANPEIVREAEARRTRPEFIDRPGFHRCPRCKRVWPEADYRPGHLDVRPNLIRARCRECRWALKDLEREVAQRTGECIAIGCGAPHVARYQCADHLALSDAGGKDPRHAANAPSPQGNDRVYTGHLTVANLAHQMNRRLPGQLSGLMPIIADDPERTPAALRGGRSRSEWRDLAVEERIAIITPTLLSQTRDSLIARYGVRLNDGRQIEPTEARLA